MNEHPYLSMLGGQSGDDQRIRLKAYQDRMLALTIRYAYDNSPFYRRAFDRAGISAPEVQTREDLGQLSFFTTAQDLIEDPFRFIAVPREKLLYVWMTAGTTGNPKRVFYTKNDITLIRRTAVQGMRQMGIGEGDVAQICYAYGRPSWFTGPFLQSVLEELDCFILAAGNQRSIKAQIDDIITYKTTILFGTPTYIHRLTVEGSKIADLRSLSVKTISLGAEPWPESLRRYLKDAWNAEVYDSYGMTETGLAVAGECSAHEGLHAHLGVLIEVIDPETGQTVKRGQPGELVFTTIHRRGMPLIRYRSGDISRFLPEETCPCGAVPTERIARIKSRVDHMTFLGAGENIYPRQFDEILLVLEHVLDYQLIVGKRGYQDTLLFRIETDSPTAELERDVIARLYREMPHLLHDVMESNTIAEPVVEFFEPGTLTRSDAIKANRFIDQRWTE